jgi:hypothetical protein
MASPIYKFKGQIFTNYKGNAVINELYHFCQSYSNQWITLDWSELTYMDANLSALLLAVIHKLKKERNLQFFLDYQYLKGPMNIFWRNGLAQYIFKSDSKPDDNRLSTIALKAFKADSVDKFAEYIEIDLLEHRGVDQVSFLNKEKVKSSYFEIFNNYEIHAQTQHPVLACGQFFPQQKELKFTLVDLGVGFLKNISEFTKNTDKITKAVDAINWAIKGGSTKKDAAGGTGLKKILFYCLKSRGSLHIVSDDCYWVFDQKISDFKIANPFVGTTIHLIFRYE